VPNPNGHGEPLGRLGGDEATFALIAESQASIEQRLKAMGKTGMLGSTASLNGRIRAAAIRLSTNVNNRGNSASKQAKVSFLLALGAGLSVQAAAALVGVPEQQFYRERRRDADFAAEWADALEARTEPIEDRLHDIAMTGDPGLMSTIKAATSILAASNPRHRNRTQVTRTTAPDGSQRRVILIDDGLTPD
jgi:hypothetical protein